MSALLESTSLKSQWRAASFFPRCWSLLSAAVDLYPETILSAAGFNWNISVAWTDLTVFCRALFSLCMLPDMINVLFQGLERELWGGNVFECCGFTMQAHALLTVWLYWVLLVYFLRLLCASVCNQKLITTSLLWLFSLMKCSERKMWVFSSNSYDSEMENLMTHAFISLLSCAFLILSVSLSGFLCTPLCTAQRKGMSSAFCSLQCSSIEQCKNESCFPSSTIPQYCRKRQALHFATRWPHFTFESSTQTHTVHADLSFMHREKMPHRH